MLSAGILGKIYYSTGVVGPLTLENRKPCSWRGGREIIFPKENGNSICLGMRCPSDGDGSGPIGLTIYLIRNLTLKSVSVEEQIAL